MVKNNRKDSGHGMNYHCRWKGMLYENEWHLPFGYFY